jgi:AraC-like DNA-binding protein
MLGRRNENGESEKSARMSRTPWLWHPTQRERNADDGLSRAFLGRQESIITMKVSFIKPRRELRAYIESFWVCESSTGLPLTDQSLAVPNGCSKLIIPYENSLGGTSEGCAGVSHEHGLYFVGNRDKTTLIHSSARKTGFIGIEFSPHGAYPLFGISMQETVEPKIFDAEEIFGPWARAARETLCNLEEVHEKVNFVQDELVGLSRRKQRDNRIIDFCVKTLKMAHGRMRIKELERKTGYTRRYLDLLFREHVGLSPKVLAGVFRFQRFYQRWAQGLSHDFLKNELYDYYYDQAHFWKECRKMTGCSPREFVISVSNEFGRRLALR